MLIVDTKILHGRPVWPDNALHGLIWPENTFSVSYPDGAKLIDFI